MASEKFRQELRNESKRWQQDGLISPEQQQQLADRYQLDQLDEQASSRFTLLLIVVGSILVGLGIITYVAANWQEIPKVFRSLLLFSVFTIANLSGFYLHRKSDKLSQTLGQGLLIIGGLTLGATMALLAQMYHISGPLHPLLLTWSFGILLMAYALRNSGLGILSALILWWAGGMGWAEFRGFGFGTTPAQFGYQVIILNLGILSALAYLPLAKWTKSNSLFTIAILVSTFNLLPAWHEFKHYSYTPIVSHLTNALLLVLPSAFLWAYPKTRDRLTQGFSAIAKNISILGFGVLLYLLSFRQSFLIDRWMTDFITANPGTSKLWIYGLPGLAILSLITLFQWSTLVAKFKSFSRRELNLDITIGAMMLITFGYCFIGSISDRPELVFVMNGLLAILSIGCLRESLETRRRSQFWYGLLILVLQILTRFLEYDTELIFKALILTLCGIGIIVAGIWFEKYAKQTGPIAPAPSSGDLNP